MLASALGHHLTGLILETEDFGMGGSGGLTLFYKKLSESPETLSNLKHLVIKLFMPRYLCGYRWEGDGDGEAAFHKLADRLEDRDLPCLQTFSYDDKYSHSVAIQRVTRILGERHPPAATIQIPATD